MKGLEKDTIVALMVVAVLAALSLRFFNLQANAKLRVAHINAEGLTTMQNTGKDFILDISRISEPESAVVEYVLNDACDGRLQICVLDMEYYAGTEEYDRILEGLKVKRTPTLLYIEHGQVKYHLNSPLDPRYFEEDASGTEKAELRKAAVDKINAFIDGAKGDGPAVDEELR